MSDYLSDIGGFAQGFGHGLWGGVKGTAEGLGSLAEGAYGLATDPNARVQAWNDAVNAARTAEWAVENPGQAASAVGQGAANVYNNFVAAEQQAVANGQGAQFWGNILGQGAFAAGTVLLPGLAVGKLARAGELGDATQLARTAGTLEETAPALSDAAGAADGAAAAVLPLNVAPRLEETGLSFNIDLPAHLAGPDGWKNGLLYGTHNADEAIAQLESRGANLVEKLQPSQPGYTLSDTPTPGISTLDYNVINPNTGLLKTGAKTVYDPSVYSDANFLDLAQQAGSDAFSRYIQDPSIGNAIDGEAGGVTFRSYINFAPETGAPYIGNVHPINPADAVNLSPTTAVASVPETPIPPPVIDTAPTVGASSASALPPVPTTDPIAAPAPIDPPPTLIDPGPIEFDGGGPAAVMEDD